MDVYRLKLQWHGDIESQLYLLPILGVGWTSNMLVSIMPDESITHLRDDADFGGPYCLEGVLEGGLCLESFETSLK